jgi:2-polyprenyl-3-methyl-5-hydroxy-6-metoxy-1,4-benzoquinol methylase
MLSWLFLELTEYAWFRRLVWKPIYETLASKFPDEGWHFMNYGYIPHDNEQTLTLPQTEEIHRYSLQLYHYLAVKTPLENKHVLEVGSGRGGGSRYIAQYLAPATMTGMDLATKAVSFSNKNHKSANLKYIAGNAENIPAEKETYDIVINVESCHAYGSVKNFLSEVNRVLKPGGKLLLTDLRGGPGMELLKTQLQESGLKQESEEDITDNVVKAIEADSLLKWERINSVIPRNYQKAFGEFSGVAGSQIHKQLSNRDLIYYRFVLAKPAENFTS